MSPAAKFLIGGAAGVPVTTYETTARASTMASLPTYTRANLPLSRCILRAAARCVRVEGLGGHRRRARRARPDADGLRARQPGGEHRADRPVDERRADDPGHQGDHAGFGGRARTRRRPDDGLSAEEGRDVAGATSSRSTRSSGTTRTASATATRAGSRIRRRTRTGSASAAAARRSRPARTIRRTACSATTAAASAAPAPARSPARRRRSPTRSPTAAASRRRRRRTPTARSP